VSGNVGDMPRGSRRGAGIAPPMTREPPWRGPKTAPGGGFRAVGRVAMGRETSGGRRDAAMVFGGVFEPKSRIRSPAKHTLIRQIKHYLCPGRAGNRRGTQDSPDSS